MVKNFQANRFFLNNQIGTWNNCFGYTSGYTKYYSIISFSIEISHFRDFEINTTPITEIKN